MLASDNFDDSIAHDLDCLRTALGKLENLIFNIRFDGQVVQLRLDVGVQDSLPLFVDNDDTGDVFLATRR